MALAVVAGVALTMNRIKSEAVEEIAARDIASEGGTIDFADHFKEQLVLRLLQAI